MKKERGPYILANDDDGHHYVIPKAREKEWWDWLSTEESTYGQLPEWAEQVGGSPTLVEFDTYVIR